MEMKTIAGLTLTILPIALASLMYGHSPPEGAPTAQTPTVDPDSLVIDDQGAVTLSGPLTVKVIQGPDKGGVTLSGPLTVKIIQGPDKEGVALSGPLTVKVIQGPDKGGVTIPGTLKVQTLQVPDKGEVTISGALTVDTLEVEKSVRGPGFYHLAPGGRHKSTPQDCYKACADSGGRMATLWEMYRYAWSRRDICAPMWVLDDTPDSITYEREPAAYQYVAHGFPMYTNQTKAGCGRTNTKAYPRLEEVKRGVPPGTAKKLDCGCYSLR